MEFGVGTWSLDRNDLSTIYFEGNEAAISDDLKSIIVDGETVLTVEVGKEIAFIKKPPYEENEDYFYQSEMFQW